MEYNKALARMRHVTEKENYSTKMKVTGRFVLSHKLEYLFYLIIGPNPLCLFLLFALFWIKSESLDSFRFFPPDCESLFLSSLDV